MCGSCAADALSGCNVCRIIDVTVDSTGQKLFWPLWNLYHLLHGSKLYIRTTVAKMVTDLSNFCVSNLSVLSPALQLWHNGTTNRSCKGFIIMEMTKRVFEFHFHSLKEDFSDWFCELKRERSGHRDRWNLAEAGEKDLWMNEWKEFFNDLFVLNSNSL